MDEIEDVGSNRSTAPGIGAVIARRAALLGGLAALAAPTVAAVPRLSDAGRASPGETLEEVEEWGSRTHASLFVVRGGLENERERVVMLPRGC